MPLRLAPAVLLVVAALAVGACSATGAVPTPAPATPVPSTPGPATPRPDPSPSPPSGNVVGEYPELSVEVRDGRAIDVAIEDPEAKAWRLTIAGTGDRAGDRLELVIEVGDIVPAAELREIRDGTLVDTIDLTGMIGSPTAAAGACHATLPVCLGSDGITFPAEGVLRVHLDLPEPAALSITAATAGWPDEPFTLGPWEETLPFAWPQG